MFMDINYHLEVAIVKPKQKQILNEAGQSQLLYISLIGFRTYCREARKSPEYVVALCAM